MNDIGENRALPGPAASMLAPATPRTRAVDPPSPRSVRRRPPGVGGTGPGLLVRVLEYDPELAAGLASEQFELASQHAVAEVIDLPRQSRRSPQAPVSDPRAFEFGLLVLEGALVRRLRVGNRTSAELVGPGDIVRPSGSAAAETSSIPGAVAWEVIQDARLARLDRSFLGHVAPWPEIAAAVAGRATARADRLAFYLAVSGLRRVEDRLLLVLWELADRWGRVTPHGVELRLTLTHELLSELVGARRPVVTVSAHRLAELGLVQPRPGSRWLLHGPPPRQLQAHAARALQLVG